MRFIFYGLVILLAHPALSRDLNLVVLGDMPYGTSPKTLNRYEHLIDQINRSRPDLVIHVGDTKSGGTPCTDEVLRSRRTDFDRFDAPMLYTPGDNEWTDCHRRVDGSFDPLERLDFLRKVYFAGRHTSFGHPALPVTTQGAQGYPENMRLQIGKVMVMTLHVVGSQNNMSDRPGAMAEFLAREQADLRWISESFAAAGDAEQIVVAMQADMFFLGYSPGLELFFGRSPFGPTAHALAQAARQFGKPVLLVHGDTHQFRSYRPFPHSAPNLTAVETYGNHDIKALGITLSPGNPDRYHITTIAPASRPQ